MASRSERIKRIASEALRTGSALALIFAFLSPALSPATSAPHRPGGEGADPAALSCRSTETTLFSCSLGEEQVKVCAGDMAAVYLSGRGGHVELELTGGRYAQSGYSGGGETQIAFTKDGVDYVVYDRTIRTSFSADGRHGAEMTSGVLVSRPDRPLSDRRCTSPEDATIARDAARLLPEGRFFER